MASERNRTEEKKTYTVGEIAEMLGISDKVAYTLVKSGQFKYVRVGRAIRKQTQSPNHRTPPQIPIECRRYQRTNHTYVCSYYFFSFTTHVLYIYFTRKPVNIQDLYFPRRKGKILRLARSGRGLGQRPI